MLARLKHNAYAAPIAAFALAGGVLCVVAVAAGFNPLHASTWIRWDSGIYLWIAKDGYVLFPCAGKTATWCGNAGWMPAYPAAAALMTRLGLPLDGAGVMVASIFSLSTLLLVWNGFLDHGPAAG